MCLTVSVQWTEYSMKLAVNAVVVSGMSNKKASEDYSVPLETLRRKIQIAKNGGRVERSWTDRQFWDMKIRRSWVKYSWTWKHVSMGWRQSTWDRLFINTSAAKQTWLGGIGFKAFWHAIQNCLSDSQKLCQYRGPLVSTNRRWTNFTTFWREFSSVILETDWFSRVIYTTRMSVYAWRHIRWLAV